MYNQQPFFQFIILFSMSLVITWVNYRHQINKSEASSNFFNQHFIQSHKNDHIIMVGNKAVLKLHNMYNRHWLLKCQTKTAADNILLFYSYLSKKRRLDVSCESSAKQRIHLKHQVSFSLKNNEKYLWMLSAAVVIYALRVNNLIIWHFKLLKLGDPLCEGKMV